MVVWTKNKTRLSLCTLTCGCREVAGMKISPVLYEEGGWGERPGGQAAGGVREAAAVLAAAACKKNILIGMIVLYIQSYIQI